MGRPSWGRLLLLVVQRFEAPSASVPWAAPPPIELQGKTFMLGAGHRKSSVSDRWEIQGKAAARPRARVPPEDAGAGRKKW